jgi:PIN domain nuclease of toxin-antitoxin system
VERDEEVILLDTHALIWLATHRRLEITGTVDSFVERISSRTVVRPITAKIAALANEMALVTKDANIRKYR